MDPASIGTTARIASAVARPIIARLFVRESDGAGLVDRPVRVAGLLRWRGEKRSLNTVDMWKIAHDLVDRAIEANPAEHVVPSDEREPVAEALAMTLSALGELDMDDIEVVRLGHRALARRLLAARPHATRDLSADASVLHDSLLDLSCLHVLHFFTQRSTFVAHALLAQTRLLDETLRLLDALVERSPRPGSEDETFETRYLAHVVSKYGKLNIFGLDLSGPGRARWPLDTAYLSLELASPHAGGLPSAKRRRVEEALAGRSRALLRGLAGSGKTTLMQWLAVSAAQDSFPEGLAELRGRIPFMLPLRALSQGSSLPRPEQFLSAVGSILHGLQPEHWADRVLRSGRGMLLIDGVDEVSETERPQVRRWLLDLVDLYPHTFFLVTTRPSAVDTDWLAEEGFPEFDLLPMNRHDVDRFIQRWHDAVLTAVDDLEERRTVERCRGALRDTLRRKHDLFRLSTNPLMCALICALHRDRRTHLPERRMELYAAALTMLLVRRDKEREIAAPEGLAPTEEAQVQLLQRIAYWLIRNGRSEAAQASAVRIIREKLPTMPQMAPPSAAEDVFRFLLLRSGVLREPAPDTVDFIHRTFQDYLGAKAAVEAEDLDLLADRGRDDQWEDVIRLAVGHARDGERAHLLQRLLQLGDETTDLQLRRRYHLLAAAALEHATTLDPAVRAAVLLRASALIPPANGTDAEQLATAGDIVLDLLPAPAELTLAQAQATLTTVARIGGEAALRKLVPFKRVHDREVRQQLALSWPYFDARAFVEEILVGLPLDDLTLHLSSREQIDCLSALHTVPHVSVRGHLLTDGLIDVLAGVNLHSLAIAASSASSFGVPSLEPLAGLRRLTVESCDVLTSTTSVGDCAAEELVLHRVPEHLDLAFLSRASRLRSLTLSSPHTVPIPKVPLPRVTSLDVDGVLTGQALPDIAAVFPGLTKLTLRLTCRSYRAPVDLSVLRGVTRGRIAVTLVDTGKVHGLEALPADRVTVRHEGRPKAGRLRRRRTRAGAAAPGDLPYQ
ncbi:NACHT domain-containing protein [Streptomyces sp. CWNU-52B]|uniref:NACHT domain-containing protein n=1 Tax=unclassified Streptomyces TaxID=2593676 RepID=UPI0039C059D3